MSRLIFDIETDGLLPDLTCIHSLCIKDADTGKSWSLHHEDEIAGGIEVLMRADQIIGHNIIKFDLPAIKKVCHWFHIEEGKVLDTLVCSRLIWPDIKENDFRFLKRHPDFPKNQIGRHGLEAWGHRMGLHKGDYAKEMKAQGLDPWAAWNPEMQAYCEQDVEVTHALLKKIEGKNPSQQAVKLEHDFQWVLWRQEQHGFPFDKHKAEQLLSKLLQRRAMLEDELRDAFPPWEVRTPFIPKVSNAKRGYVKGQLTYKTKQIVFNPGSRDHIANRLMTVRGWKPTEKTTSGKPKVDESVLSKLPYPEAKLLSEYLLVQKRLGQLAEGRNSWLNMVREDGRIHGEVITNGAVTGRCTHRNPNVAQVPSVKVGPDGPLKGPEGLWGYDCRELFHAPPGFVLVGADASGLELRCLAHFMGKYDGGDYARVLLEGDIHTVNQQAAGLPTRNNAKTFISMG